MTTDPVEAALEAAARAEDHASVWAALEPLGGRIDDDARLARMWAEALRATPKRPTLVAEAERVLEAWPRDPAVVGAACAALLRAADRPIDEPPLAVDPASIAASATDRCLGRLAPALREDPEVGGRLLAQRAHALRLLGPGRLDDAVEALEAAIALAPDRAQWHFELGLVHKHRRDFEAMLRASQRARALSPDRASRWNVAIAATALGRSELAAEAWREMGIEARARPGALPLVEGMEPARIRLATVGPGHGDPGLPDRAAGFEVAWVQPLSPCHGVVRSPTWREAVADFGDVVLWDGAPVSVSPHEGRPVPCFPLLAVLSRGDERRFRFLAMQQRAGQVDALSEALPEDVILYTQGERIERVCPRCAAGETLVAHDHLPAEDHRIVFGKLLAPGAWSLDELSEAIERAREAHPGVLLAVPGLHEARGDTRAAGKHHQRWGAIQRTLGPGT